MKPHIVIGANWGDEGKGLMVDYLCRKLDADIVCRFNGGAQAGHTVVLPNGTRHLFKHFGAGLFAGADTYLGEHFVCNPHVYLEEQSQLTAQFKAIGMKWTHRMFVHPNAFVTTPYDMVINQELERYRGGSRQGSTGLGFNETIERSTSRILMNVKLHANDYASDWLTHVVDNIRFAWVPYRLEQVGLPRDSKNYKRVTDFALNNDVAAMFIEQFLEFHDSVEMFGGPHPILHGKRVVFEGAQGLALDQNHRDFPHVTRSNTGITNALAIIQEVKLSKPRVTYVTRSYATRHGAGPLPNEYFDKPASPLANVVDSTNMVGEWQGALRFGKLDTHGLANRISADLYFNGMDRVAGVDLAVTCLDQHRSEGAPDAIAQAVGIAVGYCSYGPSYTDVLDYID